MITITKGYKKGRAVMFYDAFDADANKAYTKVPKDDIVKFCEQGLVSNAKVQWWQGKAIVRVSDKNLPLVKIDDDCNVIGVAHQSVRKCSNSSDDSTKNVSAPENNVSVANKAVIIGKVKNKQPKKNISYAGYDYRNIIDANSKAKTIDYSHIKTVGDMFDMMAEEFKLSNVEQYKSEFSKKVKLDLKLNDIGIVKTQAIQSSLAVYMMNMSYEEINEVFLKYSKK